MNGVLDQLILHGFYKNERESLCERERERKQRERVKKRREEEVIMHGPIKNQATTFQNHILDKVVYTKKIDFLKSYIIL